MVYSQTNHLCKREQKRGPFFRARSPRKKTSRERRSRREPEKNSHFGTLTTHFLRERSTHMMRVPAAAPHSGLCAGDLYLPITLYSSTSALRHCPRPHASLHVAESCFELQCSIAYSVEPKVVDSCATKMRPFFAPPPHKKTFPRAPVSARARRKFAICARLQPIFLEKHQHP